MALYKLNFINGVAQGVSLPVGTYTPVSSTIAGYDGGTVNSFVVAEDETEAATTIAAAGSLTVTVNNDADAPVDGGTLQFTSEDGNETYGSAVPITSGTATFANVPYDDRDGVTVYVNQPTTAEGHTGIGNAVEKILMEGTETMMLVNKRVGTVTEVSLADGNYEGIMPINGTVIVRGE